MDIWSRLVKMAALGATDSPWPSDPSSTPGEEFSAMLADVEESDPARTLLRRAAVVALGRRAGFVPLKLGDPVKKDPAAPRALETRRRCGRKATDLLELILDGGERFLPELLSLMNKAELRLPEEFLPRLLELGVRRQALRRPILSVLGRRGEWLAALNPRWSWVSKGAPSIDAGSEDIPESDIDLRDGSALLELAGSLLTCQPRPFERDMIEVRTPTDAELGQIQSAVASRRTRLAEIDPELQSLPVAGLLARIDPRFWECHLGGSPERLVRMAARSEAREMLLRAWTRAAEAFRAIDWVEALIAERLQESVEDGLDIFRLLPPERQEFWLLRALRQSRSLEVDQPSFWLLTRAEGRWGENLAEQLWPMMIREIGQRSVPVIWDWQEVTRRAAQQFDPRLASAAADYFAATVRLDSPLVPDLLRFITDLGFRARMVREIRH